MTPIVTLGICVRNGEHLIQHAIESILNQSFPFEKSEVIIVDDGSTDNTPKIIADYMQKLGNQARVFTTPWRGLGCSRQTIVDNSSGIYIIWVDCDNVLSKDFVQKQVEFMDANPLAGIGKGKYSFNKNDNLVATLENMEFLIDFDIEGETNSKTLGTSGCIYRVEAIRQVGGFNKNIKNSTGEDMDAEYRIREKGWKLYITNAVFYEKRRQTLRALWKEYFWHGTSARFIMNKDRNLVNIAKFLPPVALISEFQRVPKAFKLTHKKAAILLPLHYAFKRAAWILGFIKSTIFSKEV